MEPTAPPLRAMGRRAVNDGARGGSSPESLYRPSMSAHWETHALFIGPARTLTTLVSIMCLGMFAALTYGLATADGIRLLDSGVATAAAAVLFLGASALSLWVTVRVFQRKMSPLKATLVAIGLNFVVLAGAYGSLAWA